MILPTACSSLSICTYPCYDPLFPPLLFCFVVISSLYMMIVDPCFGFHQRCRTCIKHNLSVWGHVSPTTTRARTQGKPLENKRLKVSYARPSSSDIQHANLYVSKLDPSVTKEKMDEIFAPYGTIIDSKILVGNQHPTTSHARHRARFALTTALT